MPDLPQILSQIFQSIMKKRISNAQSPPSTDLTKIIHVNMGQKTREKNEGTYTGNKYESGTKSKKIEKKYDPENLYVDMSKVKITNWPQNSRVHLPRAVKPGPEVDMLVRKDKFKRKYKEYKSKYCENYKQKSNLTPKQQRGLKSPIKKIKNKLQRT